MLITSSTRRLQAAARVGHAGHSRCGAVRRLLIAACTAITMSGCSLDPNLIFDTRTTGGDNAMRSLFSDAEASLRSNDRTNACDVYISLAEVNVDLYKDISPETMDTLRQYQKRCGRYVFK